MPDRFLAHAVFQFLASLLLLLCLPASGARAVEIVPVAQVRYFASQNPIIYAPDFGVFDVAGTITPRSVPIH